MLRRWDVTKLSFAVDPLAVAMGLGLVCPKRDDEHRRELERLERMPLDDRGRQVLQDACAGLEGHFEDGGFKVEGGAKGFFFFFLNGF